MLDRTPLSNLVTTKEAAKLLGISENSLRIKVCRGEVRALKFFSRLRFDMDELKSHVIVMKPLNIPKSSKYKKELS